MECFAHLTQQHHLVGSGNAAQPVGLVGKPSQCITQDIGKTAPRLGQVHAAVTPLEQRDTKVCLKRANLPADRCLGDMQLLGRTRYAAEPGGCLERQQRGQRGE